MASSVIGALRVNLGIDSALFNKGLKESQSGLASWGKKMAIVGTGLSASLTGPIVAFGLKSLAAFKDSERALAKVDAALKSTGGAAGLTIDQLTNMAAELQKVSVFDDDEILEKVTTSLLRFSNIAGTDFPKAQQAILDVASAMKIDLSSASKIVGKALNDPAKGLGGLTKLGIKFTAEQKKMIDGFAKSGQIAKAQGVIYEELAKKFGGQAAALAGTLEGSQQKLMNDIGNAMESVGEVIAKVLPPIIDALSSLVEWFNGLSDSTKEWIVIVGGIAAALGPALGALGLFMLAIAPISLPLLAVGAAIGVVTAAVIAFWPEIKYAGEVVVTFVNEAMIKLQELPAKFQWMYEEVIRIVSQMITELTTWFGEKFKAAVDLVKAPIDAAVGWFNSMYDTVVGHSIVPDMVIGILKWTDYLSTEMPARVKGAVDKTKKAFYGLEDLKQDLKDNLASGITDAFMSIVEGAKSVEDAIKDLLASLASMVMNKMLNMALDTILDTMIPTAAAGMVGGGNRNVARSAIPTRGMSGGAGGMSVQVNNYSSERASARETTDSRGNRRVEVTVGEMVAGELRRPGSAPYQAVRSSFGARPSLVGR